MVFWDRSDTDNPVSPSDQWVSRKSSPDAAMHDRQVRSGGKKEMACAHWIGNHYFQFNKVTGDRVFPVLPYVREEAPVTD